MGERNKHILASYRFDLKGDPLFFGSSNEQPFFGHRVKAVVINVLFKAFNSKGRPVLFSEKDPEPKVDSYRYTDILKIKLDKATMFHFEKQPIIERMIGEKYGFSEVHLSIKSYRFICSGENGKEERVPVIRSVFYEFFRRYFKAIESNGEYAECDKIAYIEKGRKV